MIQRVLKFLLLVIASGLVYTAVSYFEYQPRDIKAAFSVGMSISLFIFVAIIVPAFLYYIILRIIRRVNHKEAISRINKFMDDFISNFTLP